jgi:hypothetical protein
MGRQEILDAADAIAVFDFGAEGMFVPVASGTLQGAGFYDADKAVSRMATPLDFATLQSVPPPTGWNQFHTVVDDITARLLAQGALDEVLAWAESVGIVGTNASGRREITFGLHLMISNPGDFATGAGSAYSQFIEDQAQSYLDLVVKGMPWMLNAYVCAVGLRLDESTLAALVLDHLRGQPGSQLDAAITMIENQIAAQPVPPPVVAGVQVGCSGLLEALVLLRGAVDAFMAARVWLSQDFSEIYEDFGYIALFLAETLRSREFARAIADAAGAGQPAAVQAEKIGSLYGTLIGVVIWEIIEDVFTAGFGKGARILKVVR